MEVENIESTEPLSVRVASLQIVYTMIFARMGKFGQWVKWALLYLLISLTKLSQVFGGKKRHF